MFLFNFLVLTILFVKCQGVYINGKEYDEYHFSKNGVSHRILHQKSFSSLPWVVRSVYNKKYLTTGWDSFDLETNPEVDDNEQAFLAGYLEGAETHEAIYDHYFNTVRSTCDDKTELCQRINHYLDTNIEWIKGMVEQHAANDPYWNQVNLFYLQMAGIVFGYNSVAPRGKILTVRDIMWINFNWDFGDLESAMKNETNKVLKGNSHCRTDQTAEVKDILNLSSNPLYETMRRIMKRYYLPYKNVTGTMVSFSGYPGTLVSGDDFYIINSGLVVQETTNDNNNASLWAYVRPTGQVLEVIRVTVANRLAGGGRSWTKIFSQYNSGTYNNQWMVVDMNKFSPGSVKPELLWILEQMPGYIRAEDQTDVLTAQSYWASYNIPFYPDVYNMSGTQTLANKYGDFFTYDKCPRARIFKRDHEKVLNAHTMMQLMRSNDFQHDPLSRCNCSPPYSAENAIAARNDLNLINGTYPFPALSHRSYGAIDAKVTSYKLSQSLSLWAVSGPSTGAHLPPFRWSTSDFNRSLPHRGHPDLFNFQPVLFSWPSQQWTN
ncbi:putative phospholipase B-like 2 [Homalodisca vitripennis]|uniref:putative phospholipase B-like 2 n=1 Tax=Homalodisca vitripennis TaxID=197043 RepID=UPI001EEA14F2|nr:putative phospholipase B-like 2 [Homalodisca vitripennis]